MRLLIILLLFSWNLFAQKSTAPNLEFVMELKVSREKSLIVGNTAHGERKIVPITGGIFEGPNIKGVVLSGGADYQFVNNDNTRTEIEAIYNLKTDDGILIHIRNVGLSLRTKEQADALARGEKIDITNNYFRAIPKFEAPIDSKYNWLNDAVFICTRLHGQDFVHLSVWKVL